MRTRGMTLVELLVVMALIAMLMSLALPAINAAREAGRKTQCLNNVRQLALAAIGHESTHSFFPGGGWGGAWVGIPGRGTGLRQPGSWGYALLQFLERNDLSEIGVNVVGSQQEAEVAQLLQTSLAVMYCPTRRQVQAYPIFYDYARRPFGSAPVSEVARSDYAINAGDQPRCEIASWFNPPSLTAGDDPSYPWPKVDDHTGVSYLRSQITSGHFRDGLSRTYLFGEKHLSPANYWTGADHGDDWSLYTGYQDDLHRTTFEPPRQDSDLTRTCRFGAMHSVWHVSFCDGAARALSFDIDPAVHKSLGHRADRMAFDDNLIR